MPAVLLVRLKDFLRLRIYSCGESRGLFAVLPWWAKRTEVNIELLLSDVLQ